MRGVLGPILTTGVALSAAVVVVTNPIVADRADVQIPSVALSSGSADEAGMLDQALIDAIAPDSEPTNPLRKLKDLISSLAADATELGKAAVLEAFVAGVTAVSEPELTTASNPFASPTSLPPLVASVLPGLDFDAADLMTPPPPAPEVIAMVAESVAPAVESFVSGVVSDVSFVSKEIITAAFVAGATVIREPGMIIDTLQALLDGDIKGALKNALKVVFAPLVPTKMVLEAIYTVIEKNIGQLPGFPSLPADPESPRDDDDVELTDEQERLARVLADGPASDDDAPAAAAALAAPGDDDVRLSLTEIVATPTASAPTDTTAVKRRAAIAVGDTVRNTGVQIGAAVQGAVREAVDAAGSALSRVAARDAGSAGD